MTCQFRRVASATLFCAIITTGCASAPAASAPGMPAPATSRPRPTPGDIAFMQDMIGHHSQALVMARMVPGRTERRDLAILAERIIVSQQDEIAIMRQWLRDQGAPVPDSTGHAHTPGMRMPMPTMPGMATSEQLAALQGMRGAAFEREFLTLMIAHHGGAIVMVERLFATHGAGQDDFMFKFASDVAADQESEIARMQGMLNAMAPSTARP